MFVLGIETTCDETAAAIVKDGHDILSNSIFSQSELHQKYGGVFPEIASRSHTTHLISVIERALSEAKLSFSDLDLIAVANGPGLMGSILVGLNTAKALAYSLKIPLIGINHVEAHLYASMMNQKSYFPSLGVVLSGGHTFLLKMDEAHRSHLLGTTQDDAIGEAFDKVASILDLPYPGGPAIETLAQLGDASKYFFKKGTIKDRPFDFSFSGLKTKVLYTVKGQGGSKKKTSIIDPKEKKHIAASFQKTVFQDVIDKMRKAIDKYRLKSVYLGGGVTENQTLQKMVSQTFSDCKIFFPSKGLSLDNGAMIAGLGYQKFISKRQSDPLSLDVKVRIPLEDLHQNQ